MVTNPYEFYNSSNFKDATQRQKARSGRYYTDVDPEQVDGAGTDHSILVSVIVAGFHDDLMMVSRSGQLYLHHWLDCLANLSILPTKSRMIGMQG